MYTTQQTEQEQCYLLDDFCIIKLEGEQVATFLQGQFSANIPSMAENQAILSAHCSPKGRVITVCIIIKYGNQFYLCTTTDMRDITLSALNKYAPFSKVTLTETSELALIGSNQHSINQHFLPWYGDRSIALLPRTDRLLCQTLSSALAWHHLDMLCNVPRLSPQVSDRFIAQRLNLHLIPHAISFEKGCYVGQEIIARIHFLGQLKHKMVLGQTSGKPIVSYDSLIQAPDAPNALLVNHLRLPEKSTQLLQFVIPTAHESAQWQIEDYPIQFITQ